MSSGHSTVTLRDVPAIVTAPPVRFSRFAKLALLCFILLGVFGMLSELQHDSRRAWLTFHVNFSYFFILSAASAGFASVFTITNAHWSRPLRRVFESTSSWLVISVIPFAVLYLFAYDEIFSLHAMTEGGKKVWLSRNFMFARNFVALAVMVYLIRRVISLGLRQDIGAIRAGLSGVKKEEILRWFHPKYDRYVDGFGGDAPLELRVIQDRKGFLSPVAVIVFSIALSLFGFDLIMSIDPLWISTLFGAFIFMTGVYMAVAWNSLGLQFVREMSPLIKSKIDRATIHDLGKLLFGFGIFWTYLFWSHYITIWYGNLPEETGWLITRVRVQPWHSWSWGVLGCLFFYPFLFGLNKDGKTIPRLLFTTACVVALGGWLLFFVLIVPTLYPDSIPLGINELLVSVGFIGAFLLSCGMYLENVPLIPFGDLYAKKK